MTTRPLPVSAPIVALTLFSLAAFADGLSAQQPINRSILEPRPLDAEQQARVAATPAGLVREARDKVLHVFVRVDQGTDERARERGFTRAQIAAQRDYVAGFGELRQVVCQRIRGFQTGQFDDRGLVDGAHGPYLTSSGAHRGLFRSKPDVNLI